MGKFIDLTGQRFGKWTVLKRVKNDKNGNSKFLCKCDCGKEKVICRSSLINGYSKSCGCLVKRGEENHFYKHGLNNTRIYKIYFSMKKRCYQPKDISYKNYGGRGIIICDEWLNKENGFINFYNWAMQNGYKNDLSIDRIDNNGNYEPNNCRWTNKTFQNNNKRNNINIKFNEEIHTLKEWSRILNLEYKTIFARYKHGYCIEDIFYNGDLRKRRKHKNEKSNK